MTNERMFEMAVRTKMRFPYKGMISVEDLWDLPTQELDKVFKTLNSKMKEVKEESLLAAKSAADEELEMKIMIIKYIVNMKQAEAEARANEKDKRDKRQKIMAVLADKEDQALLNKSPEELQAMLNELK